MFVCIYIISTRIANITLESFTALFVHNVMVSGIAFVFIQVNAFKYCSLTLGFGFFV